MPDFSLIEDVPREDLREILKRTAETSEVVTAPPTFEPLPEQVDLSKYLHFIRHQWGGCWGYATLAVWDIMNEIVSPYSPNLSFRQWRTYHGREDLRKNEGVFSPDGRYHLINGGALEKGSVPFFKSFGCTTEGTEPTLHGYPSLWPEGGWSREGVNEAGNYRLEGPPLKLKEVSSAEFMKWLALSHPIRAESSIHVVAIVGFDRTSETFTFANSAGDKWGTNGFGTFSFQQLDDGLAINGLGGPIVNGYILPKWQYVAPPKPVMAARIHVKHQTDRGNVHLWLGVEDSPHPRNKIWPHGWDDKSRNLHFTVRVPREFIWPPSSHNRVVLELYDAATLSKSGGTLEQFSVAFGDHVFDCSQLQNGPITFTAGDRLVLTVP